MLARHFAVGPGQFGEGFLVRAALLFVELLYFEENFTHDVAVRQGFFRRVDGLVAPLLKPA